MSTSKTGYSTQFKPSIKPTQQANKSNAQDPTKIPTNLELNGTILFAPEIIPEEVHLTVPLLHSLPSDTLENISTRIFEDILKDKLSLYDNSISLDDNFILLQKSLKLSELKDNFGIIYTALYRILRVILRNKIPQSKVRSGLLQLNFPIQVIDVIVKSAVDLRNDKISLIKFQDNIVCRWPTISKLKWRIDVVISSGSLSRVMRPTILMRVSYHISYPISYPISYHIKYHVNTFNDI